MASPKLLQGEPLTPANFGQASAGLTTKGNQSKWRDINIMKALNATIKLANDFINGSKNQKVNWSKHSTSMFVTLLLILKEKLSNLCEFEKQKFGFNVLDRALKRRDCRNLKCVKNLEGHGDCGEDTNDYKSKR